MKAGISVGKSTIEVAMTGAEILAPLKYSPCCECTGNS